LKEVWQPPEGEVPAPWNLGRVDRCCIGNESSMTPSEFQSCRKQWTNYLAGNEHREEVIDTIEIFPQCVQQELRLWMNEIQRATLSVKEQNGLRNILHSVISLACATYIIPHQLYPAITPVLNRNYLQSHLSDRDLDWSHGMGLDIKMCLTEQIISAKAVRPSFVSMISLVCEFRVHSFLLLFSIGTSDNKAQEIMAKIPSIESVSVGPNAIQDEPNPLTSGIRYRFTESGKQFRSQWSLQKGSTTKLKKKGTAYDVSGDGCNKKRPVMIGHRQRTWIWIYTCLRHEHIIGFHVISSSEGMRDAVCPLYRYLPEAPEHIWVDYACGMAECAMNWMPHYFKFTKFYHDVFHGLKHVCGPTHKSQRTFDFLKVNTSLMEQINSELQPLRGLVASHTTKVKSRRKQEERNSTPCRILSLSISVHD
jgi:hypothetical protein